MVCVADEVLFCGEELAHLDRLLIRLFDLVAIFVRFGVGDNYGVLLCLVRVKSNVHHDRLRLKFKALACLQITLS